MFNPFAHVCSMTNLVAVRPTAYNSLDRFNWGKSVRIHNWAPVPAGLFHHFHQQWPLNKYPPARQPILEAIGQLGHAANQASGIERRQAVGGEVFDHHEVLLAAQHPHREMPFDDSRVELEQNPAIAIVDRPADRDERQNRPAFGVGPGGPT